MARPIKYTDEGHKWHREQVAESRKKKKKLEDEKK